MLLIFDGDCGFCTAAAEWVRSRAPADISVKAWREVELDQYGLSEADVIAAAWWIDADLKPHRGHLAIGHAWRAIGGVWRPVGNSVIAPPLCWLARPVYAVVARYRHKLPGDGACPT